MGFEWAGALKDDPVFKDKTSVEVQHMLGDILWQNYKQNKVSQS